jgi:hypothetical protein
MLPIDFEIGLIRVLLWIFGKVQLSLEYVGLCCLKSSDDISELGTGRLNFGSFGWYHDVCGVNTSYKYLSDSAAPLYSPICFSF